MDIRKLQRVIVDALEAIKAQHILVFNTEEQSPLFERVIVASGTSNRQTKALASSVRDAVKAEGFDLPRLEGEGNGEWIIVDCGAAVVHVMQPDIRDYYHLEEIWGAKPVRLKLGAAPAGLVKASIHKRPDEEALMATRKPAKNAPAKKAAAKKVATKKVAPRNVVAPRVAAKKVAAPKVATSKMGAQQVPADNVTSKRVVSKKVVAKKRVIQTVMRSTVSPEQRVGVKKPALKAAAKKTAAVKKSSAQ